MGDLAPDRNALCSCLMGNSNIHVQPAFLFMTTQKDVLTKLNGVTAKNATRKHEARRGTKPKLNTYTYKKTRASLPHGIRNKHLISLKKLQRL